MLGGVHEAARGHPHAAVLHRDPLLSRERARGRAKYGQLVGEAVRVAVEAHLIERLFYRHGLDL